MRLRLGELAIIPREVPAPVVSRLRAPARGRMCEPMTLPDDPSPPAAATFPLDPAERAVIDFALSEPIPGLGAARHSLRRQLDLAVVSEVRMHGEWLILSVAQPSPIVIPGHGLLDFWVIDLIGRAGDGALMECLIFVRAGYLAELEWLRLDDQPAPAPPSAGTLWFVDWVATKDTSTNHGRRRPRRLLLTPSESLLAGSSAARSLRANECALIAAALRSLAVDRSCLEQQLEIAEGIELPPALRTGQGGALLLRVDPSLAPPASYPAITIDLDGVGAGGVRLCTRLEVRDGWLWSLQWWRSSFFDDKPPRELPELGSLQVVEWDEHGVGHRGPLPP